MKTPILDEFIEELEEFKEDNMLSKELEKRLIEFKKIKEAINFTGSSLELKDNKVLTFEEYKKIFYDTYFIDYYKSKKTKNLFDEKDLIKKYENYTKPLIT